MEIDKILKELKEKHPSVEFRVSPTNPSEMQRLCGKQWFGICTHGRRKSICKECGGASICTHGRRKHLCKECGGVSICPHGRHRHRCKECRGSSICTHGKVKSDCKNCGGSSFCTHGRQKNRCKECGGKSICTHGKQKNHCKECGGKSLCTHGRQKNYCKECGGSSICTHGRIKTRCKECGGSTICTHGKRKNICKECGGSGICTHGIRKGNCKDCGGASLCSCKQRLKVKNGFCAECLRCSSEGCIGKPSQVFKFDYCYPCGCFKFGRTPQQKRQDQVFDYIRQNYQEHDISYDHATPDQNCTKFRPDILFLISHRKLIVECDENSHKAAQYDCETKRMSDLFASGEIMPTVFIRFNPDVYRDEDDQKRKISLETRLLKLKQEIDKWLDPDVSQEHMLTVVYLYYDHNAIREETFIPADWDELKEKESDPEKS